LAFFPALFFNEKSQMPAKHVLVPLKQGQARDSASRASLSLASDKRLAKLAP
jgi:hypothetical protein